MKPYTRVYARIDLDAIEHNMEMMKKNLKEGVSMISVIKTDGYGHGSVQIGRMLASKEYIWGYAVATLDEAVVLRKGGITKPILVLGCIFPDQWEDGCRSGCALHRLYQRDGGRDQQDGSGRKGSRHLYTSSWTPVCRDLDF